MLILTLTTESAAYIPHCRMKEPNGLDEPLQDDGDVIEATDVGQFVSHHVAQLLAGERPDHRQRQKDHRPHKSNYHWDRYPFTTSDGRSNPQADGSGLPFDQFQETRFAEEMSRSGQSIPSTNRQQKPDKHCQDTGAVTCRDPRRDHTP